jgi:predicted nucleic acid-binding protein
MESKFIVDSNVIIHASKSQQGPIALWLTLYRPVFTDVSFYECITRWQPMTKIELLNEKKYIEGLFSAAQVEGRYIESTQIDEISSRATTLSRSYNIKSLDAIIAATAEFFGLILVTADTKKDFAPRLQRLNELGLGRFLLQTYDFANRESIFALWNAQAGI